MSTREKLEVLAEKVDTCASVLEAARQALSLAQLNRKPSFRAWVIGLFRKTPAEKAVQHSEAAHAAAKAAGIAAASEWAASHARQALVACRGEYTKHLRQSKRCARARVRLDQVQGWKQIAEEAHRRLRVAQAACDDASATELLDAVTRSKTVSMLSSVRTSEAALAIRNASTAMRALVAALPKSSTQLSIEEPDDFPDLAVDLVLNPSFDLLSWSNMDRLDIAGKKCRQAAAALQPLLGKLNKLTNQAESQLDKEQQALLALETPFLEAAMLQVPSQLRETQAPPV